MTSFVKLLASLVLTLSLVSATAQDYFYKKYNVQDGLPTDIVKACEQDAKGHFWIATDEGLSKYDGTNFKSFNEYIENNYVKGFHKTKNGRLIVFGDQDLKEIINTGDSIRFERLCPTSIVANDSSVNYPKHIFEDKDGSLWISEAQSIIRLQGDNFKRFEFGIENRTTQFLRSFSAFEDKRGDLYTISYHGNVFKLNTAKDEFEPYHVKFPADVEFVGTFNGDVVIGSVSGLYTSKLSPQGGFTEPKLKLQTSSVSYVKEISNNEYFVATRWKEHFIADSSFSNFSSLPYQINDINHVYVSDEADIWAASNEGLILLKENLFRTVSMKEIFVESVTQDPSTGKIYYATSQYLYEYDPANGKTNLLIDNPEGYFQSLTYSDQGLWVANAFKVFLWNGGKMIKEYDFSDQPRFVSEVTKDSAGSIWLTITGQDHIYQITRDLALHKHPVSIEEQGVINMVKAVKNGVYASSSGEGSYLFFKNNTDSLFRNVSLPIEGFASKATMDVSGFVTIEENLYLASSIGLLEYANNTIKKIDLGGKFTNLPIRSISTYDGNKLLFSNAYGLISYDLTSGVIDLFNESYGLSSRTISQNGVWVGEKEEVWVCTSQGLCYSSKPLNTTKKTKYPQIVASQINGKAQASLSNIKVNHGGFVSFKVSSITFPESDVNYQYRLSKDSEWINGSQDILLSNLNSGKHRLEVRAKKFGPFTWSDPTQIALIAQPAYWQNPWFIALILIGISGIVYLTYLYVSRQNEIKNYKLQELVNEKTTELRVANKDLKQLNAEKNSLIQIVAHDLKSPVAQIIGLVGLAKGDSPEEGPKILTMIENTSSNMLEMVNKILNVQQIESKKLQLNVESVSLSMLLEDCIHQYSPKATSKDIQLINKLEPDVVAELDKAFTKQVFDNLLSNAIKFSPKDSDVVIRLSKSDDCAVCEFVDNGPGLAESDKEKLFGKFQRLSAKPTGNESSTGLGLSIVKKFVEAQNGKIWVESEQGKGARFVVEFPLGSK